LIETRSFVPTLAAADPGIAVGLYNLPAAPLRDLAKLAGLVLDRLIIGADSNIERGLFQSIGHS
jgi:hypothetical protein